MKLLPSFLFFLVLGVCSQSAGMYTTNYKLVIFVLIYNSHSSAIGKEREKDASLELTRPDRPDRFIRFLRGRPVHLFNPHGGPILDLDQEQPSEDPSLGSWRVRVRIG